ncbi:MAG: glycosyltransferase [Planctomycetes bacterium]|nr:glycosyltransferase [Planctomycetota bacterium]
MSPALGIIIPTLREARWLPGCLDSLADSDIPVLVVDGGSDDQTAEIATRHPRRPSVAIVTGGRHAQLNAAFNRLNAEWILLLPADARLLPGAVTRIVRRCATVPSAIACLRLYPDDRGWYHQVRAAWSGIRCRLTGGAYMDQAPLFRRREAVLAGGFRNCGPYDSADLGRRLGRHGSMIVLPEPVVISCREYRRLGVLRTTLRHQRLRWQWIQAQGTHGSRRIINEVNSSGDPNR